MIRMSEFIIFSSNKLFWNLYHFLLLFAVFLLIWRHGELLILVMTLLLCRREKLLVLSMSLRFDIWLGADHEVAILQP
jgi:hypothetical protein